jgi:hypothetical protein
MIRYIGTETIMMCLWWRDYDDYSSGDNEGDNNGNRVVAMVEFMVVE